MSKSLMRSDERISKIKHDFQTLQSWEDRYQKIISLGKELPPMEASLQTDDNKVRGCQSQVWLSVQVLEGQFLHFTADSDALIVKGLVALLLYVYQDLTPSEILSTSPQFLKDLGLEQHLSPSRTNGLQSMLKQIQYYAAAYQHLLKY